METYNPKFLKHEQPQGQAAADLEVFALVKNNPSRKVNADQLPPVVFDNDGTIHFMQKEPTAVDMATGVLGVAALAMSVVSGIIGAACAWFTGDFVPVGLTYGVIGIMGAAAVIALKGEKTDGPEKL